MIALIAVLAIAAVSVGWLQLRKHNEGQSSAAAATCFDGAATLQIAADPGIAPTVQELAARYNATHPVIRDQCVTVTVQPEASSQFILDLGKKPSADLPAMWVPQSSVDLAEARAEHPDAFSSSTRSMASSPVVLAVAEPQLAALRGATWQDLPARVSAGELGLALPQGGDSGATTLALAAVVAAVTDSGGAPLSGEQASAPAARTALSALRSGGSANSFASTADALAAVSGPDAGALAVAVTEQQLYQRTKDQSGPTVRALSPGGATPVADYPAAVLSGAESDETLSRAASSFSDFARQPEQRDALAAAGFQVPDTANPASAVVSFNPPQSVLPMPTAPAIAAISPRGGSAAQTHATTVLLDVSGSMGEQDGERPRLANVTAALRAEIAALPDTAAVGLWRYSANMRGTTPYTIDVITGPLAETVGAEGVRRALLDTALALASPLSATHTYTSLEAAYAAAVAAYIPGQSNSVLLITDGPNDDQSNNDTAALLATLSSAQDPARPVAVNVIVIGANSDLASLQSVADQTGGTLTTVDSAFGAPFSEAVRVAMG